MTFLKAWLPWFSLSAVVGLVGGVAAPSVALAQPTPQVEKLGPDSYRITVVLPKGTTALEASSLMRPTFRGLCPIGVTVSWKTTDSPDGALVFVGAVQCSDGPPPLPVPARPPPATPR
jgi:hypothetical protein